MGRGHYDSDDRESSLAANELELMYGDAAQKAVQEESTDYLTLPSIEEDIYAF